MRNLLLSFSLILTACGPSRGCSSWEEGDAVSIWIDDPDHLFSDAEKDTIWDVCQEWSEATDQYFTCQWVEGKGLPGLVPIRPDTLAHLEETTGKGGITRWVPWEKGGAITLSYDLNPVYFRLLILHEFGHTLGLSHDQKGTIMYYLMDEDVTHITCRDVQQFCQVNDCVAEEMRICQ